MEHRKDGNVERFEFRDLREMREFIRDAPKGGMSHVHRPRFCKFSWDETMEFLKTGWHDGIRDIDLKLAEIERKREKPTRTVRYHVQGDFIDIGRYTAGHPKCFGTFRKEYTGSKEIHLAVACSYAEAVDQEDAMNRGAAIMALVDKLRKQNRNVVVDALIPVENLPQKKRGQGEHILVNIRFDTSKAYSRDSMAFCLVNPAYLRRCMFAVAEKLRETSSCGGYGSPDFGTKVYKPDDKTVYIPPINATKSHRDFGTEKAAIDTIEGMIEKSGVLS